MKKTLLATGMALALSVGSAQAAFFTPGSEHAITITSGCFAYGTCIVDGIGNDDMTDNAFTVNGVGSGIVGDGVVGVMNFTVGADGNTLSLTSFSIDTYTGTAQGNFPMRMADISGAGGFVDDAGNMTLDLTGRTGIGQFTSASLGEQAWNLDTHGTAQTFCAPGTGLYTPFTTGASTALNCLDGSTEISLMGSPLTPTGNPDQWSGMLVSAGNVGASWFFFDGTPYSEIYNITIGPPVVTFPPFFPRGATGTITVTSGCFTFGTCAVDGDADDMTDNDLTVGGVGSGIAGDGVVGLMNFTVSQDGNTINLTSFNMDTHTATPLGNFATRMQDLSSAGGFVDDAGNMTLDVTGRTGLFQGFLATFGEQPWNIDTHGSTQPFCAPGTGLYTPFTTSTSAALNCIDGSTAVSVIGNPLTPTANANEWTGTLVSAGVVGDTLALFDGTPYSEIYNLTVNIVSHLEGRLDDGSGNFQAYYDNDLDITWLADATPALGPLSWQEANDWVAGISINGIGGWRLPTSDTCSGTPCTGSEMGHLFYNELGGLAGNSISSIHNNNFNLFSNIQPRGYWSGTEDVLNTSNAWRFDFSNGAQDLTAKVGINYAWAVRSGDVADLLDTADLVAGHFDDPDPVTKGELLTYTLTVINNGPADATGVAMMDTLPADITFESVTPDQGTCTPITTTTGGGKKGKGKPSTVTTGVDCDLGNIAARAAMRIILVIRPNAEGTIVNSVNFSANEEDSNINNNTATESTTVTKPCKGKKCN